MAVGVDYSLFYVRRAREERARGASRARRHRDRRRAPAVAPSSSPASPSCVAMAGLLLSGNAVFSSMAVGTMLVVAVAVLGSLTVLPAVLSLLGDRVDRPRVPLVHRLRRGDGAGRFWPARHAGRAGQAAGVARRRRRRAWSRWPRRRSGMRAGRGGRRLAAAVDPRSCDVRRDDRRLPADRLRAHGRRLVRRRQADWTAPRCSTGVDGWWPARSAAAGSPTSTTRSAEFAPDGRTATVDLADDRRLQHRPVARRRSTLLRDELAPTLRDAPAGHRGRRHRGHGGHVDFTATLRSHLPLVVGFVLVADLRGAGAGVPVGRGRGDRGRAEPAVGRRGVRAARAGLPARARPTGLLGVHGRAAFIVDWLPLFLFVVLFGLSMDYHVFVVSRIREAHAARRCRPGPPWPRA